MKAVAATCWTVKSASASMARISSGDCCGGATIFGVLSAIMNEADFLDYIT